MHLFHGTEAYARATPRGPRPVTTIGNFDGVHLGHRSLVDATRALAQELSGPSCVLTFDPAPRDVLRPDNGIPRIQSLHDKLHHLEGTGVEHVVVEPFDRALAAMSPRAFADEILVRRLHVQGLVLGWDFRFGAKRAGTVADLIAWLDVPVRQVDALELEGRPVSSSRIRTAVREGRVAEAARLLGRPHEVVGEVVRGDQRGRQLGFPTANVHTRTALLPAHGVYAVRVQLDDEEPWLPGVANLGTRPTFDGGPPVLEVHLLDGQHDLYGRTLRVGLVAHLREERRFDGPDALVAALNDDIAKARAVLAP